MKASFRTVLCLTTYVALVALPNSAYPFAIGALGAITLRGNNVESDSFDSSDIYNGVWNINGYYTNGLRKAGGDIVSTQTITNSVLSVGNAKIGGKLITGPSGSIVIGPQGSVGDIPWITDPANNGKIKTGWMAFDLNIVFSDVILPAMSWTLAAGVNTGGSGTVNGKSYDHVFNYSGYYTIADSGTIYVGTNISVRLNITTNTFSPNYIYVAGTGWSAGKMIAYLNGPPGQAVILETDHQTQSGKAENLMFLGLPNCTSIAYKGNGDFTGAIYAPQADLQFVGGGSSDINFSGACVAKTVQINGHYHFHFDESLGPKTAPISGIGTSLQGRPALVGQNVVFYSSPPVYSGFTIPEQPVYQWRFNGTNILNATNSSLSLTNVQLSDAGQYSVVITDGSGPFSVPPAVLQVYASAAPTLGATLLSSNNQFQFTVSGVPDYYYIVEASTNFVDWDRLKTNRSPFTFSDTNLELFPQRFFRAVRPPNLP